ncbi:MAG: cytochrome P450 [Pseudomonadota bacterium]
MKLFGDLLTVSRNVPAGFKKIKETRGDRASMAFGPVPALLFSDPADVKKIMTAPEPAVTKSQYSKMLGLVFGDSIISAEGEEWERQHDYLIEHFHPRNVPYWTKIIVNAADKWLTDMSQAGDTFAAEENSRLLIQDIMGELLFGDLINADERRKALGDLQTVNDELFGQFIRNTILRGPLRALPTPGKLRVDKANRDFTKMVFTLLEGAIPSDHPSITAKLLALKPALPKKEIRDQLSILYFAGQDTTARALSWTYLLLSQNPEQQEIIAKEGQRCDFNDESFSVKSLPKTYNVVQESLRLYPPAHALDRQLNEGDFLNGVEIDKPRLSPICVTNLHSDERHWDNPTNFDPERFSPQRSKNRATCAYMPFGHGKRLCIGKPLALLELTIIVAMTCRRYQISCLNEETVKPKAAVSLGPSPDIVCRFERRA